MTKSNSTGPKDAKPETSADLDALQTEAVPAGLDDLDVRPVSDVVKLLVDRQGQAHAAAVKAVPELAAAVERVAARLAGGGRLFYVGAGTSGRLAMLDAAECVPTFDTPPELVVALIAGGEAAFVHAVEGAEDNPAAGAADLAAQSLTRKDAVVGITASGRTPYVIGALEYARRTGAYTAAIVNNPRSALAKAAEQPIELLTGPEVLAGSTRLAAGTAQKIALNTLSTAVMVRLGKTHGAYMVDLRATNSKLRRRALRIVRDVTGADETRAAQVLSEAGGRVKTAIVALLGNCDAAEAERRLDRGGGWVRAALEADV
jgi:N-acetylmuramic acid 6-phosphate etherase